MMSDNVKRKSWTRNKKQEKKRKSHQIWSGVSDHWVWLTFTLHYISLISVPLWSVTSLHSDGFHWLSSPRSPRWGGHVTRHHSLVSWSTRFTFRMSFTASDISETCELMWFCSVRPADQSTRQPQTVLTFDLSTDSWISEFRWRSFRRSDLTGWIRTWFHQTWTWTQTGWWLNFTQSVSWCHQSGWYWEQVSWQVEQVRPAWVHVNEAQVCHHLARQVSPAPLPPGAGQTGQTSFSSSSVYIMRRRRRWGITAALPLWLSGSQQFNSSDTTFVKCLGPLDPSQGLSPGLSWTHLDSVGLSCPSSVRRTQLLLFSQVGSVHVNSLQFCPLTWRPDVFWLVLHWFMRWSVCWPVIAVCCLSISSSSGSMIQTSARLLMFYFNVLNL